MTLRESRDPKTEPMTINPYEPPAGEALPNAPTGSMLFHNAAAVFGCALAGGALGLAIGVFIGAVFPGYYHAVFRGPVEPVEVGAGLGLVQGTSGGFFVGILLVVIHSWYRLRWTRQFIERERSQQ